MQDCKDSWKNRAVFEAQLHLNQLELAGDRYPQHWIDYLALLQDAIGDAPAFVADVGCGAGVMAELLRRNFPNASYMGFDYASEAIDIARVTWPFANFLKRGWADLEPHHVQAALGFRNVLTAFDLTNVLPDGDTCVEHLLSLGVPEIILGKVFVGQESGIRDTYKAYDLIETYRYVHNQSNLHRMFARAGYVVISERMAHTGVVHYHLRSTRV